MRFHRTFLILALLLLTATTLFAWESLPAGNPEIQIFLSDSSGQKLMVGLNRSGLWLTQNGGSVWQPFNARLGGGSRIDPTQIVAADAAADTLLCSRWYTYYPNEIHRTAMSYDGGMTWAPLADDTTRDLSYTVHPLRHNIWFRSADSSLDVSEDYGQTWTNRPGYAFTDQYCLRVDPRDDNTLYAGTHWCNNMSWYPGLARSTDLGVTWSRLANFSVLFSASSVGVSDVACLSNGDILITVDGLNPSFSGESIVLSTDSGDTWQRVSNSPLAFVGSRIIEARNHPGRLFLNAACVGGIWRSDDYGRTWQVATGGLPSVDVPSCNLMSNSFSGTLYVAYPSHGLYHSLDDGETWQPVGLPSTGVPETTIHPLTEGVFAQCGSFYAPTGEFQTEPPFTSWQPITFPTAPDSDIVAGPVYDKQGQILYCMGVVYPAGGFVSQNTRLYSSDDNGATWNRFSNYPGWMHPERMSTLRTPTFTRTVVGVGQESDSLAYTTDHGLTWTNITRGIGAYWNLLKIEQTENAIYTLTSGYDENYSGIWRTTDLGATWDSLGVFYPDPFPDMTVIGDTVHVARMSSHTLMHWYEGEWHTYGTLPCAGTLWDWKMVGVGAPYHLLVTVSLSIDSLWLSSDGGQTWSGIRSAMPDSNQFTRGGEVVADPDHGRLWVSTGSGIYYYELYELTGGQPSVTPHPAKYTLLSAYPNPFNNACRIRFDLDRNERVSLNLYDLTGRMVKTLVDEVRPAGSNEISFEGNNLASGVYFIRLSSATTNRTQKIVLLK